MKLIIGLGNPGTQYEKTRHNIGFLLLDEIKNNINSSDFKMNEKFSALISEKKDAAGEKIFLVKPQTFMNRSGEVTKKIMDFYKVSPKNIFVIHDDLDILTGEYKKSLDSTAAGHNGAQNIIDHIGTKQFVRYRIGIEGAEKKKDRTIPGDVFVLQNFTEEELSSINISTMTKKILTDLNL
jgi:PTH1 family peptidyl-tRNA hydrolase